MEKNSENIKRESNFELLKIISMLMIIMYHFILHGKILDNTNGILNEFMNFMRLLLIVHVNSFVLVTGYFQYNKEFKLSRLISHNNALVFYKIVIMLIFLIFGLITIDKLKIIQVIMPFNYGDYWFMGCYLLLYLVSPLLNIIIRNVDKITHKNIIIIYFIITSIISTLTNDIAYYNNNGFSVANFIFLYFIGAYIHKYDLNLFNKSNNKNKIKYLIFICISLALLNTILRHYFLNIFGKNNILDFIGWIFVDRSNSYCNPIVIIQTISYFLIFKNLKINIKTINLIASNTLGIYLIHDNEFIREYMYKNIFNMRIENNFFTSSMLYKIPVYVFIVFIICLFIEIIRKKVFKYIYNMSFSKKFRNKISNHFAKIEIKW